ncbi:MAG: hypothetical protein IPN11_03250 [Opitutaceae bacterium]|nr:hypothetical protein [Opitutaceae bacterium]
MKSMPMLLSPTALLLAMAMAGAVLPAMACASEGNPEPELHPMTEAMRAREPAIDPADNDSLRLRGRSQYLAGDFKSGADLSRT